MREYTFEKGQATQIYPVLEQEGQLRVGGGHNTTQGTVSQICTTEVTDANSNKAKLGLI